MHRFFGVGAKPKVAPPSLDNASDRIDSRVTQIDQQILRCDQDLAKFKAELSNARGPAAQSIKQRALAVLKRKRMYEDQRNGMLGTQFNIDQNRFAIDQLEVTKVTVDALTENTKLMKKEFAKINIDKIEKTQDIMQDLMDDQQEIQEVLGRSYGLPFDVDESELDAELSALEAEVSMDSQVGSAIPSYIPSNQSGSALPELPKVPSDTIGLQSR